MSYFCILLITKRYNYLNDKSKGLNDVLLNLLAEKNSENVNVLTLFQNTMK